jgi:hypothetical protein
MDSWTHGLMGLMGLMDSWTHGPMDLPWTSHGPMNPWTYGPMDLWTSGPMDPWTHGPFQLFVPSLSLISNPLRYSRVRSLSASLSFTNISVLPSKVSDRFVWYAMFARCGSVDDR